MKLSTYLYIYIYIALNFGFDPYNTQHTTYNWMGENRAQSMYNRDIAILHQMPFVCKADDIGNQIMNQNDSFSLCVSHDIVFPSLSNSLSHPLTYNRTYSGLSSSPFVSEIQYICLCLSLGSFYFVYWRTRRNSNYKLYQFSLTLPCTV